MVNDLGKWCISLWDIQGKSGRYKTNYLYIWKWGRPVYLRMGWACVSKNGVVLCIREWGGLVYLKMGWACVSEEGVGLSIWKWGGSVYPRVEWTWVFEHGVSLCSRGWGGLDPDAPLFVFLFLWTHLAFIIRQKCRNDFQVSTGRCQVSGVLVFLQKHIGNRSTSCGRSKASCFLDEHQVPDPHELMGAVQRRWLQQSYHLWVTDSQNLEPITSTLLLW